MKECKTFRKEIIRLEAIGLTKDRVATIIRKLYSEQAQVLNVNLQNGYAEIELWVYTSSFVIIINGGE